VEDNVDVWRYAILSCMPETTTTIRGVQDPLNFWHDPARSSAVLLGLAQHGPLRSGALDPALPI